MRSNESRALHAPPPESLILLLSVMRENPRERAKLAEILSLDSLHRKMAVNFLVMQLRQENAPDDFICAWDSLQDDNTAEQAKQLLDDQKFDQRSGWWSVLLIFGGVVLLSAAFYLIFAMIR